jgi:sugar lactone lactonase YvrE
VQYPVASMKKTAPSLLLILLPLVLLVLAAYLLLWPVPVQPLAWVAPAAPGYVGVHKANPWLGNLTLISLGQESGPEHVVLGPDGKLYVAVASGNILRMNPDGSEQSVFARTGGRVLGFDFDASGRLIAADAIKGLLAIAKDGQVSLLTDQVAGDPIRYADAVVVAKSGKIYFSDASRRFAPRDWGGTYEAALLDIVEQQSTGRVLEYSPSTRRTRVVAQGLSFANGVALSDDEQSLLVAETGRYRIWKIAVAAKALDVRQDSPLARVLLDNLPGYPDNLMRGQVGLIWVGLSGPRSAAVDRMAEHPFLRSLTLRLPRAWWPVPKPYGHVVAFTEDGQVHVDMQDPSGSYPQSTGVTETADRLYFQNLHNKVLGWKFR